jgi:hypothetical protein
MINKLMAGINELHNENQQKQAEVCLPFLCPESHGLAIIMLYLSFVV